MDYKKTISKDEINQLPRYIFEGHIALIKTEKEARKAALQLKNEKILGFDTETKAAFKKGESYDVSLLQLATQDKAFLFRLNKMHLIKEVIDILEDPSIIKAGVAIRDDVKALKKLKDFKEHSFVDLAEVAREKKITNFGLRALTAIFLEKRLSKGAKISNWECQELTEAQIHYAAADAVVGHEIYKKLCQ